MLIFNQRENLSFRRRLRVKQTASEELLWGQLRAAKLGIKFRRQFGIGPYIEDFYSPSVRLVVEVDGSIHEDPEVRMKDIERTKFLEGLGLIVIRFTVHEVTGNMDDVLFRIRMCLDQNPLLAKERAG